MTINWYWIGILLCLTQSAIFSGLNLAFFSVSRLRLEVSAAEGDRDAGRVLAMRRDPNLLLATILWGNVAVNCLLTILADSVLAGASAFILSTVAITFFGEIFPQAYFSRNAMRTASVLTPLLRFYQLLLYPVTKPSAWMLDHLVGPEAIVLWRERSMRELLRRHMHEETSEVSRVEAVGAINFLDLDDIPLAQEGELLDPRSIISLPVKDGRPVLPPFQRHADDPFLRQIEASGRKWVIITDPQGEPCLALDAHRFLRGALLHGDTFNPGTCWHKPIVVHKPNTPIGQVVAHLKVHPQSPEDDVVDEDFILLWGPTGKRVITGSDLLGRLLRGIVSRSGESTPATKPSLRPEVA